MEAIATIQAIRTGWVHPTINHVSCGWLSCLPVAHFRRKVPCGTLILQESPIEEVAGIDVVANKKQQHDVNVGISNSFGFGGHNSVCAFAKFSA